MQLLSGTEKAVCSTEAFQQGSVSLISVPGPVFYFYSSINTSRAARTVTFFRNNGLNYRTIDDKD